MLKLQRIVKDYQAGDTTVHALRGVSLQFRESEFVAILGHSGCGKTTMLNIIGGLDHYTSGDLIINGKSTKDFSDADWDSYRNHSIGFVFQSYNLIPHQSVLSNVELALTLSGVSKSERRERAKKALESVGLGDQMGKKPNQMSGGQMQRVGYRRSAFLDTEAVVLGARLRLTPDDPAAIRRRMDDLMARRRQSQPLEYPSAGSTFKRPEGYFAGTLIEQTGLKGLTVGGAQVSTKHAGFVINVGGATSADVEELIRQVQQAVYAAHGVHLEPEVRIVR